MSRTSKLTGGGYAVRSLMNRSERHPSAAAALTCLAVSVVMLGHALQIANGFYSPAALGWLTGAIVLCMGGVMSLHSHAAVSRVASLVVYAVMTAGIAWQVIALLSTSPGMYINASANIVLFKTGVFVEATLIGMGVAGFRSVRRYWFPALLVGHMVVGAWMLRASPSPHIDVVVVHRTAIDALVHGRDPYRITFPNIYGADSGFYNSQAVVGDRVMFGYPYPPLSLLLALPGEAWMGDYRYAELAALVMGAGFIGYAQPTMMARLAASLLLTTPRVFFVLEQGWTEPIAVLLLACTVFCLVRKPSLAPWAAGLLVVTKQYLVLAGPLLPRIAASMRGRSRQFLVRAAMAALVATVPLALWHPRAFIDDVVLLQMREPFRIDSLSYLSWAARAGWGTSSFLWSIAAGGIAVIACLRWTPNTPAGFAGSVALSSVAMFAFGSKAFCNYYFYVVAAICCTIAAIPAATGHPLLRQRE